MANTFKIKTKADIPTTSTTLYTVPASTTSIVLLTNKAASNIKASVYLESSTSDNETNENVTLLHDVPVPQNSALEVFQGQKLVLQTTDVLKVKCDTASSLDFLLSILELT